MDAAIFGIRFYDVYTFLGTLFMNALKMLIVPLIISSIITGMAGISDGDAMGRLGGKTLLYYALTSLLAISVGLLLVNLVQPGIVDGKPAGEVVAFAAGDTASVYDYRGEGQYRAWVAGAMQDLELLVSP